MSDFYTDMAAMVTNMLSPSSSGGLGQGTVELSIVTPGVVNPEKPWEPPAGGGETLVTLKAAARGVGADMIGKVVDGTVLVNSDRVLICAVPDASVTPGSTVVIDGTSAIVLGVEMIPAAGVAAAVRLFVRG